jgi:hypothetical protein
MTIQIYNQSNMVLVDSVIDTENYRDLQENYRAYNFVSELEIRAVGSCPDLIIKERTAAALAWHGGH